MNGNQVAPVVNTQPVGQEQQAPGQPALYGQPGQQGAQLPPVVWMPKPTAGLSNACPPGLEYLTQVDQILIKQQIEIMELLSNWEAENKYRILNTMGQQVYFAKEESDACHRQCCRGNRGFTMHVTDNLGNEVIRLEREFRCWRDSAWCACSDCCAHRITVEAPVGTVIGYVRQKPSFCIPTYAIMDADENERLYISGPCCVCQGCPCDVNFTVHSATDGDTDVGKIQKQWSNVLQEMFTQADNFGVTFPMDLDVKMKAIMIGATFLIDFLFFEVPQNRHGNRRRQRMMVGRMH
ncbi:phospholipid scramblase 1-like [Mercenaria mercenaria]|uniref:phospholipid scramblase 1-like n=1 Tax=Mercenaria mercenaria TaxID=6596 RepID=UPI00234E7521|nr:phospholipid scramblase 1-like [Mercenaria mercenaria]XP_053379771.1 phospholipid scramblase 1-like [Mercenaria mercenaria]